MTLTAQQLIAALTARLDAMRELISTHLIHDSDRWQDCQPSAFHHRCCELEEYISGITDADIAPQEPEPELITEALATANRAYCGGFDDLRINEPLLEGARGDLLADYVADEIRITLKGENTVMPAVNALKQAAEHLLQVADALDPNAAP